MPASSESTPSIIDKALADAIDPVLSQAYQVQCYETALNPEIRSCVDRQSRVINDRTGKIKLVGWHEINASKLCAACACYWHLSCARNFALGVVR